MASNIACHSRSYVDSFCIDTEELFTEEYQWLSSVAEMLL